MKMKKFLALVLSMCMIFSMSAVVFAEGDGSSASPEVLTALTGDTISVPGGTNTDGYEGYYYNYTVPSDVTGTVQYSFSVDSASETSYIFNVDNLTTGDYGQIAPQYEYYSASVKASAGDVIQIKVMSVATWDSDWTVATYPAIDMTWSASSAAVGTASSPEVIETLSSWGGYQLGTSTVVTPNTDGYYYSYTAEVTGTLSIYIDENATLDPWVEYPDYYEDDELLVNNMNELAAEIILTNTTANKSANYSDGTTDLTVSTGYGSETYKVIQVDVTAGDEVAIQISSAATGYDNGVTVAWGAILQEPYGSVGNPVSIVENNQEVEIPAGETYFVSFDNYTLQEYPVSIEGGDAVVYDYYGTQLEGQTDITVEPAYVGWNTYCMLQIENTSDSAVTYTLAFDMPLGISMNPEVLETNDEVEHTFEANDTSYYYYTWTAESDGIVVFTVDSDAAWRYSVDNETSGLYAAFVNSIDENIQHIALDVKQGDVLCVYVSAVDYNTYTVDAATTVTTTVEFTASEGVMDVEDVEDIVSDLWADEYEEAGTIVLEGLGTVLPYELLAELITYNTDYELNVGITLVNDVYTWILENVDSSIPVDLGITFDTENIAESLVEAIADGNEYVTFSIAHDGTFGFDAVLQFTTDSSYAGKTAALYWNNNGTLELVGEKCTVSETGAVSFAMSHASDYVMVIEGTATTTEAPDTADMAPIAMIIAIAAVAAVVVLKKRETVEN